MESSSDMSPSTLNTFGSAADLVGRRSWAVTLQPAAVNPLEGGTRLLLWIVTK